MKRLVFTLALLLLSSVAYAQVPSEGLTYIYPAVPTGLELSNVIAGPARTALSPANCGKPRTQIQAALDGSEFDTNWKSYISDPFNPGMFCEINIPRTLNNGNAIPAGIYRFVSAYSYPTCNIGGQVFTPCDGERLLVVEPTNFRITAIPTSRPPRPTAGVIGKAN